MRGFAAALVVVSAALAAECDDDVRDEEKLPVRTVTIRSRHGFLNGAALPLQENAPLTQTVLSESLDAVRRQLRATGNRRIEVVFVGSCVTRTADGGVAVEIRPWTIRVGAPVGLDERTQPRSRWPGGAPPAVGGWTVKDPELGVGYDRALDTTARAGAGLRNSLFEIDARGERSMRSASYRAEASAIYAREGERGRLSWGAFFDAIGQPLGPDDRQFRNALRTQGGYRWSGRGVWFRGAGLAAGYRFSNNRTNGFAADENAFELRSAVDYRFAGGVGRTAILGEVAKPDSLASYRRAAIVSAWSSELPVGSGHTVGVELQLGAGGIRGVAPRYAQFFAGSQQNKLLLDDSLDGMLAQSPLWGPQVRALGVAESAAARSYAALNVTAALPVPRWSRFLIPPEPDEDGVTLGQRIEGAGLRSSESSLIAHYQLNEGLGEAEAKRRAAADLASIRPAVTFISRYAKLYAVRPLALLDVAKLNGPADRTLVAAGGGLQFVVVVARLDAGYVWLTNRRAGDPRGNLVFRLSFQNLF